MAGREIRLRCTLRTSAEGPKEGNLRGANVVVIVGHGCRVVPPNNCRRPMKRLETQSALRVLTQSLLSLRQKFGLTPF